MADGYQYPEYLTQYPYNTLTPELLDWLFTDQGIANSGLQTLNSQLLPELNKRIAAPEPVPPEVQGPKWGNLSTGNKWAAGLSALSDLLTTIGNIRNKGRVPMVQPTSMASLLANLRAESAAQAARTYMGEKSAWQSGRQEATLTRQDVLSENQRLQAEKKDAMNWAHQRELMYAKLKSNEADDAKASLEKLQASASALGVDPEGLSRQELLGQMADRRLELERVKLNQKSMDRALQRELHPPKTETQKDVNAPTTAEITRKQKAFSGVKQFIAGAKAVSSVKDGKIVIAEPGKPPLSYDPAAFKELVLNRIDALNMTPEQTAAAKEFFVNLFSDEIGQ